MEGISERTFLRGVALQALYEYDLSGHKVADILTHRFESVEVPNDDEKKFVIDLVTGVINHKAEIDEMIKKYAVDWPIEQVPTIDVNIIRIAAYEFAISKETPDRVAINESVELAKRFGSDTAPKFVNGVLGSIADNLTESPSQK
ncbi:MAG: transcription antitermination factor NusB [Anaerolineaceae bacterium]|nr:transcription antitermination factor NusB [Anaerolineaceae bacterium]